MAVFPEGVKGTGKPFSERYRLQRFGRGGFVELALRTGAPIVPVAVVGSEEIYPMLGRSGLAARALRAPYFPLTPTFPWLGPLGMIPLPVEVADRVLRPDPDRGLRPRRGERPRAGAGALRAGARHHPAEGLREPGGAGRGVRLGGRRSRPVSGPGSAPSASEARPWMAARARNARPSAGTPSPRPPSTSRCRRRQSRPRRRLPLPSSCPWRPTSPGTGCRPG